MSLPKFTIKQLMEAGVHFGHHKRRWNPKLKPFLFGERNKVHIINLQKTAPMLYNALKELREITARGGTILFVGTKRQASPIIAETADRCGQFYVNHRWLGGMLTNWKTIQNSINKLKSTKQLLDNEEAQMGLTKKELLKIKKDYTKLELVLGGIKDMKNNPSAIIVIDTSIEQTAILEANKLKIPVFGIVDSNGYIDTVDHPIIANDDSIRAIQLYCNLFSDAILDGIKAEMTAAGIDLGSLEQNNVNIKESAK